MYQRLAETEMFVLYLSKALNAPALSLSGGLTNAPTKQLTLHLFYEKKVGKQTRKKGAISPAQGTAAEAAFTLTQELRVPINHFTHFPDQLNAGVPNSHMYSLWETDNSLQHLHKGGIVLPEDKTRTQSYCL